MTLIQAIEDGTVCDYYGHRLDVVRQRLDEAKSQWAKDWLTQLEKQLIRNMQYHLGRMR